MSPYMQTLSETEFFPRKYSAESMESVIVIENNDNDEVMIEYRERKRRERKKSID